jgi:predicted nucleotide-binding protein (sugar kinase/HSP70/actin superfamily)
MIRVGIPRALLYYQYYPGWKTFFEDLDVHVVVSQPTNKAMLDSGVSRAVADTCLPVKILFGHVLSLVDKCDYVFVPAISSLGERTYNCSKIIGLPNMARALIPECPAILDPVINVEDARRNLYRNIYKLGRHFTSNPFKLRRAVLEGWKSNLAYRDRMSDEGITPIQAIEGIGKESRQHEAGSNSSPLRIAVIGHPYVIYDEYINHRIIARLQSRRAKVFTPEMVSQEALNAAARRLAGAPHWSFESDIIGAGEYYLEAKVGGLINISVFGCGPDSMMIQFVQHRAEELGIPFLPLSLDEHSSEGGLLTRLEAFLDMVKRREKVCV